MKRIAFIVPIFAFCLHIACNNAPAPQANEKLPPNPIKLPVLTDRPHDSLSMQAITFPSKDGLTIHARVYHKNKALPVLLLCHQAGSSKDEYNETAQLLADWGYNSIAIDQRAGGTRLGGNNETATLAEQQGKATEFSDAEQDIEAAIEYAFKLYDKPIILVGSSYSASLALKFGAINNKILAVAAFSPGEYFKQDTQYIAKSAVQLKKPAFITSSKAEIPQAQALFDLIPANGKVQFKPDAEGIHGSRALWQTTMGYESYRKAFKDFLDTVL